MRIVWQTERRITNEIYFTEYLTYFHPFLKQIIENSTRCVWWDFESGECYIYVVILSSNLWLSVSSRFRNFLICVRC